MMELAGTGDTQVSHALGKALQSNKIGKDEKLAALDISKLGGVVNFRPSPADEVALDRPANVLVGRNWTGGDETFIKNLTTFKKIASLETLLVTRDSGVSDDAIAKLQAEMPGLTITRFVKRVPSATGGRGGCPITWRNRCRKEIVVLWVDELGKLQFSSTPHLKPGQELKRHGQIGIRYEAHYLRKDYAHAEDYLFSQPISTFAVVFNGVWEINPQGKTGR